MTEEDSPDSGEVPRRPDQATVHRWISIAVPLALGLGWAIYAVSAFRIGGFSEPGPALWPLIVGTLLMLLSIVRVITDRDAADYEPYRRASLLVVAGAAMTGIFIVAFVVVGFLVSSFVLILFWMRVLGGERWRLSLVVAASSTIVLQLIFGNLLSVPFSSFGPS